MKKSSILLLISVLAPCVALASDSLGTGPLEMQYHATKCPAGFNDNSGQTIDGTCYYSNNNGTTCYAVTCGTQRCSANCNVTGPGARGIGGGENKVGPTAPY